MRFIGDAVVTRVEVLVEEIIAVTVEVLAISLKMHQGGGHQFNFCKVKGPRVSSDGIEALYQSKVDISSHSDANGKERVCYFLKSRLPTAPGTMDDQKVVVLRDTGCTGVVVRKSLVSEDQLIGKESTVTLIDETTQRQLLMSIAHFFKAKLRHYVWMSLYTTW